MPVLPIVIIVVVLLAAWLVLRGIKREDVAHMASSDELAHAGPAALHYTIPEGTDAAVLVTALRHHGYVASVDAHGDHQHLLVKCPDGIEADRPRVRDILADTGISIGDPAPVHHDVVFEDE